MELKWLEDFLSLAATRSFSRSAEARGVTQSAFSRRIRSLEIWLGTELLDRSSYPIALTQDGTVFRETAEKMVRMAYLSRTGLRERKKGGGVVEPTIAIAALHTLTLTFLPHWLTHIRADVGPLVSRVLPDNYVICVQALVEGGYDFLLTFHHPSIPVPLDPERYIHLVVGQDHFVAVACPDRVRYWREDGKGMPLIQYSRNSFLGLLASLAQGQDGAPPVYVAHTNENSMAEGMRFMALEGHGIAWLPRSLVARDIAEGRLAVVAPELPMDIRMYRGVERGRPLIERVWQAARGYSKSD